MSLLIGLKVKFKESHAHNTILEGTIIDSGVVVRERGNFKFDYVVTIMAHDGSIYPVESWMVTFDRKDLDKIKDRKPVLYEQLNRFEMMDL